MAGDRTTSQAAGSQSTKHCYPDTSTFLPPHDKEVHLFWSSLTAESSLLRGSPFFTTVASGYNGPHPSRLRPPLPPLGMKDS